MISSQPVLAREFRVGEVVRFNPAGRRVLADNRFYEALFKHSTDGNFEVVEVKTIAGDPPKQLVSIRVRSPIGRAISHTFAQTFLEPA